MIKLRNTHQMQRDDICYINAAPNHMGAIQHIILTCTKITFMIAVIN